MAFHSFPLSWDALAQFCLFHRSSVNGRSNCNTKVAITTEMKPRLNVTKWKMKVNTSLETFMAIGPMHDPVTWYGINAGSQIMQWDSQTKLLLPVQPDFPLLFKKVQLRYLRPSTIYSVPCNRIVQKAYSINLTNRRPWRVYYNPRN